MKYIYSLAFKMSVSATIVLFIGNALELKYATVGAVISILSIQDTRRKALLVGKNRIIACVIGQILSVVLYLILGQNPLIFGLFLIIFIPITSKLKVEEGMIASVVLSTHLLVAEAIDTGWIINELALMVIGIGVASISNLFMPSLDDKFKQDIRWIEESYRIIISKMAKSLNTCTVDIDEQSMMENIQQRLEQSKETAYKIVNNNFFRTTSYYTDYINMRINQFDTIKRMRLNFGKFNIPVEQMKWMAEFTREVSKNISEVNDCRELLRELQELRGEFKKMELPKSRDEFESRAQLLQYLNDMEEFLNIKKNFSNTVEK